ncbi:transposase [Lacicoccus qingdaonensis]|uniref:Transposase n=1 Tax=Lacicoccus qingdaonensis TaxID=576118 RepID=A0A1G9AYW1_9BACL|nr:transposase [Salinicoccus qingdaonensis]SDK32398.1 transposase [Salinicoccus qingdaonensis]
MSRGNNYDKHVKEEAVSLVIDSGKSIAAVSRELDIAKSTVGNWVRDYKDNGTESFVGSGNLSQEKQADKDLQKRLRDLEEENKILKKAMRIFTNDQK